MNLKIFPGQVVKTKFDIRQVIELRKNSQDELYVFWESTVKHHKGDCGGCHPDVFRAWLKAEAAGVPDEG